MVIDNAEQLFYANKCSLPCPDTFFVKRQTTDENIKAGGFQGQGRGVAI